MGQMGTPMKKVLGIHGARRKGIEKQMPDVLQCPVFSLCHSKNKPPAMQGEDRSLDISMNSCAKIKVGLQNHK